MLKRNLQIRSSRRRGLSGLFRAAIANALARRPRLTLQSLEDRTVPATFVIDTLSDAVAADGKTSLREALQTLNTGTPAGDAVYVGVIGSADSIDLTGLTGTLNLTSANGGQLAYSKVLPLTITGPGASVLSIKNTAAGSSTSRVFNLTGTGSMVTMENFKITGGALTSGNGAGVQSSASLTLNQMEISGNTNTGTGTGGGIVVTTGSASLSLNSSTVTANQCKTTGGGVRVANGVIVAITDSVISNNVAGTIGGGIFFTSAGKLTLTGSTISGNKASTLAASNGGGGIYLNNTTATISNTTISGNSTNTGGFNAPGGGLSLRSTGTNPVVLQNTTVAFNAAGASTGGGINQAGTAPISLIGSIVSNNTDNGAGPDVNGAVYTSVNSLLGTATGAKILVDNGTTWIGDPLLSPLANNGGPTPTHALQAGSIAINRGTNPTALFNDQRGTGFNREQHIAADIGAYESAASAAPDALAVHSTVTTAGGTVHFVTVTYADYVGSQLIDGSTLGTGDITITGPNGFFATPTIVGGPYANAQSVMVTYQFTAANNTVAGTWDSSDNGNYAVNIVAGEVFDKDASPLAVAAAKIGAVQVAIPQQYVVNEVSDVVNGTGTLSFREALILANTDGVDSTIVFDPAVFAGTQKIALTTGELQITSAVNVIGPAGGVIFDAGATSRVFKIDLSIEGQAVTLSYLTATNGKVVGVAFDGQSNGAGIFNVDSALTLDHVTVSNSVTNKNGGGIALTNPTASLTLLDSLVTGNRTEPASSSDSTYDRFAGGIFINANASLLTVTRTTVSNNTAQRSGGGIFIFSGSKLVMTDSTVSGNRATAGNFSYGPGGGGIAFFSAGTADIVNSTIVGNSSKWDGGGIVMQTQSPGTGLISLRNSTVAFNDVQGSGGGIGVGISTFGVNVVLESSIVANNSATIDGPDLNMPFNANYSLIGNTGATTLLSGSANLLNVDPKLALLNSYGGTTQTVGLTAGSPAIDQGFDSAGLTDDQRGAGFPRQVGSAVDIGAFEGVVTSPTARMTPVGTVSATGTAPNTVTLTYSDDIGINPASIDVGDIQILDGSANPVTITSVVFTPAGKGGQAVYTFTPPGGSWNTGDNGLYTVKLLANQVTDIDSPSPKSNLAVTLGTFRVAVPITYVVDEVSDIDNGTGKLSIREALSAANTDGQPSLIVFDPAVFAGTQTITMTGGELNAAESVTIQGPAGGLVLDAVSKSRHFEIFVSTTGDYVSISNMTLNNGLSPFYGGSIDVQNANLDLTNVVISNCVAPSNGGAIFFGGRFLTLNITDSRLINNTAQNSGNGGAICSFTSGPGAVNLIRSEISGNKSGGGGGGLYIMNGNRLTMSSSAVYGNTANISLNGFLAQSYGGGIQLFNSRATLVNSTVSGNTVLGTKFGGGGIMLSGPAQLTLANSTVANNTASGSGGGIYITVSSPAASLNILSSIVANNVGATAANDIFGSVNADFSLIGDSLGATINGANNVTDVNALLGPLQYNGGTTKTHAITSASPAYNAGDNGKGAATDQRGNSRSVGQTDIGAFEVQSAAKVTGVVINGGAVQRSMVTSVKVSFDQHVGFASGAAAAFSMTRVGDNAPVTLAAAVDDTGSGTAVTLTFTGGAVDGASLADGRYALHALAVGFNAEGLDGDGNGTGGDNFTFDQPASPAALDTSRIFRLFGDADGSGQVTTSDFLSFRLAFLSSNPAFDYDGNGSVDTGDFLQFRLRFLQSV